MQYIFYLVESYIREYHVLFYIRKYVWQYFIDYKTWSRKINLDDLIPVILIYKIRKWQSYYLVTVCLHLFTVHKDGLGFCMGVCGQRTGCREPWKLITRPTLETRDIQINEFFHLSRISGTGGRLGNLCLRLSSRVQLPFSLMGAEGKGENEEITEY